MEETEKQKRPLKDLASLSQPFEQVFAKIKRGDPLTKKERAMSLVAAEVVEVLSWKKGQPVSPRYLPQMIRDGRLEPDTSAGGHAYRYRLEQVLSISFRSAGRPRKTGLPNA